MGKEQTGPIEAVTFPLFHIKIVVVFFRRKHDGRTSEHARTVQHAARTATKCISESATGVEIRKEN